MQSKMTYSCAATPENSAKAVTLYSSDYFMVLKFCLSPNDDAGSLTDS